MDRRERALGALRFVVLVLGGRSVLGASMGRGLQEYKAVLKGMRSQRSRFNHPS